MKMKSIRKIVRTLWLMCPALLLGCSPCSDKVIQQVSSPGNLRVATSSLRHCGATTSFYTRVIVRPTVKSTNEIEQLVFSARNEQKIDLSWKSTSELVVRCDTCHSEEIEYQVMKAGSLRISYELP